MKEEILQGVLQYNKGREYSNQISYLQFYASSNGNGIAMSTNSYPLWSFSGITELKEKLNLH